MAAREFLTLNGNKWRVLHGYQTDADMDRNLLRPVKKRPVKSMQDALNGGYNDPSDEDIILAVGYVMQMGLFVNEKDEYGVYDLAYGFNIISDPEDLKTASREHVIGDTQATLDFARLFIHDLPAFWESAAGKLIMKAHKKHTDAVKHAFDFFQSRITNEQRAAIGSGPWESPDTIIGRALPLVFGRNKLFAANWENYRNYLGLGATTNEAPVPSLATAQQDAAYAAVVAASQARQLQQLAEAEALQSQVDATRTEPVNEIALAHMHADIDIPLPAGSDEEGDSDDDVVPASASPMPVVPAPIPAPAPASAPPASSGLWGAVTKVATTATAWGVGVFSANNEAQSPTESEPIEDDESAKYPESDVDLFGNSVTPGDQPLSPVDASVDLFAWQSEPVPPVVHAPAIGRVAVSTPTATYAHMPVLAPAPVSASTQSSTSVAPEILAWLSEETPPITSTQTPTSMPAVVSVPTVTNAHRTVSVPIPTLTSLPTPVQSSTSVSAETLAWLSEETPPITSTQAPMSMTVSVPTPTLASLPTPVQSSTSVSAETLAWLSEETPPVARVSQSLPLIAPMRDNSSAVVPPPQFLVDKRGGMTSGGTFPLMVGDVGDGAFDGSRVKKALAKDPYAFDQLWIRGLEKGAEMYGSALIEPVKRVINGIPEDQLLSALMAIEVRMAAQARLPIIWAIKGGNGVIRTFVDMLEDILRRESSGIHGLYATGGGPEVIPAGVRSKHFHRRHVQRIEAFRIQAIPKTSMHGILRLVMIPYSVLGGGANTSTRESIKRLVYQAKAHGTVTVILVVGADADDDGSGSIQLAIAAGTAKVQDTAAQFSPDHADRIVVVPRLFTPSQIVKSVHFLEALCLLNSAAQLDPYIAMALESQFEKAGWEFFQDETNVQEFTRLLFAYHRHSGSSLLSQDWSWVQRVAFMTHTKMVNDLSTSAAE